MRTIPQLIHFAALGGHVPEWAEWNIQRFRDLNPGWMILVHRDDALLLPSLQPGYDGISEDQEHVWGRRSDLLRLSVLTRFGGWWFDWDFLPFRPIADIEADHDLGRGLFLTQGTPDLIANGVIGTAVNSPGIRTILRAAEALARKRVARAWDAFGPRLYTNAVEANPGLAVIGAQEMFYPLQDRARSVSAYQRLRTDWSPAAQDREFGASARPYMMHMSMQDALDLEDACV